MPQSHRRWTPPLVRRGLFAIITILALAVYGLVTAGTQSLSVKPAAAYDYGAASQPSVGLAISPTNSSVNVASRGPNNSLMFHWEVGGTWYGPLGLGGANTTYSAPSILAESDGNFDIAVEGPGHTLYTYWDASGTWYGPLQVGAAGSTFSTPTSVVDYQGHLLVAAQGPSDSLDVYWNVSGTWYGPLGVGGSNTAYSAPNFSINGGDVYIFAVGPNHDMREWFEYPPTTPWQSAQEWSDDGTAFSSAASYYDYAVYEAPDHSLRESDGYSVYTQIATAGTVYSAPSFTSGGTGNDRVTAQGPGHSLYFWFGTNNPGQGWQGPTQVNGGGSTYSAPAMAEDPNNSSNLDLAVQGPSNTLWFYWNLGSSWYGPVQVAGAGSTFGSPS